MSWYKASALPNFARGDKAWEVLDFLRVVQNLRNRMGQACRMFSRQTIGHRAEFGTDWARDLNSSQ